MLLVLTSVFWYRI